MTNLEIIQKVNPHEWNEEVIRLNGCSFHTYDWSLFSSESNRANPIYFRLKGDGNRIIAQSFGLITSRKVLKADIFKSLSFGSLPASEDTMSQRQMIENLIRYAKESGMSSISFHSFGTPYGTDIFPEMGFKVDKRWEFLMELCDTEDELWKKVHSKKRNLIKKGQKSGVSIKKCDGLKEVLELRNLALATQRRKEEENIPFPVAAESYYRLIKDKLIDKGLGRLYLAYEGERAIAGAFFAGFNNSAYYILSSADKEGLDKAAPDLILWTCMTDYQKEGYRIFNLGGVSEQDLHGTPFEESGLYHFKKRFSATEVPCCRSELILRPLDKKLLNGLRKTKALVRKS
jgi:hypothetical protein